MKKADIEEHSVTHLDELVVKELTASLWGDFLLFFDPVAFADNPV